VPYLHFEFAIIRRSTPSPADLPAPKRGPRAGTTGARLPAGPTFSAHYIADPGFRRAVADFLAAERAAVVHEIEALGEMTPFRKG
jgi:hypothetical protein